MSTHLIGYDLDKPGQDYTDLEKAIKELGTWWHCLDSTWIVKSDLTDTQILNKLKVQIDSNDKLLVVTLTGSAAWINFEQACSDWLTTNL
jgi:hypothetical protein